jgi:hypothetical protein
MNTAVAVSDHGVTGDVMRPAELTSRLAIIQQAMKTVMIREEDYGVIPGTPKPSLYKSGAEKLCTLFHIAPDFQCEDLSTSDCVRRQIKCTGTSQITGAVLGSAIGECSSDESKYKWRKPVCKEEFNDTPDDRKRVKWMMGKGGKPYKLEQVRTEPADMAHTVSMMAQKRALVAMIRVVTNASAMFSQDIEDLPEELRPENVDEDGVIHDKPVQQSQQQRRAPEAKPNATGLINEKQLHMLQVKMADAGMPPEQLCKRFNIDAVTNLKFADLNAALAYVADPQMNGG